MFAGTLPVVRTPSLTNEGPLNGRPGVARSVRLGMRVKVLSCSDFFRSVECKTPRGANEGEGLNGRPVARRRPEVILKQDQEPPTLIARTKKVLVSAQLVPSPVFFERPGNNLEDTKLLIIPGL